MAEEESRQTAAFFDFDRTLLATDSVGLGLKYLWKMGMISTGYILMVAAANVFFKTHVIDEQTMARVLLPFYKDKPFAPFEDGVCEFYEHTIRPRLAPNIVARLQDHQKKGHLTVLVSGSIRYTLLPVKKDLGLDHLICTDLEVGPDGIMTGRTLGPICIQEQKARLITDFAREHQIDLDNSFAYGNHQSDIPMLEMVGNAFCVQPSGPLKRHAKKRGWPLLELA